MRTDLNNLADLLRSQPGRLAEARELAEEALGISKTLDPGAAQIWTTYNILAEIKDREAAAIRRILDGDRDEERLVDGLDLTNAGIIETILHALEDPESLAEFLPGQP